MAKKRKYVKSGKYSKYVMDEYGEKELTIPARMKILKMGKYASCKKYEVTAGRTIICKDTGKEVLSITKEEGFSPTEADAMVHYVVDVLNKKKDFASYYKKYMK
uniref:Uncharacterized protein n=1 Tax=viral metagenome TaxID=1070528 RepID=A0A6M3MBQ4_9ZZZZ